MDLLVTKPWGVKGYVAVGRTASTATASEAAMAATKATLLQLRTPTSVLEFHKCFTLPPIRLSSSIDSSNDRQGTTSKGAVRIYERLIAALQSGEAVVPTLLSKDKGGQGASSFRVSTERAGRHDFSSSEVEFEAGGALQEHYGTRARMKGFEVCVRVDVIGERVLVGTLLSQPDMAKRRKYKCAHSSTAFCSRCMSVRLASVLTWQYTYCAKICQSSHHQVEPRGGHAQTSGVAAAVPRCADAGHVLRLGHDPARVG